MKVVVLQSNYVPWKGYFDLIHEADTFIFYDEVKYTKNDWRNRNRIYTKNGLQWLTIPVEHFYVHHKISEVRFTSPDWQDLHYKSLVQGYKSASNFPQLEQLATDFLLNQRWERLKDLNHYLIMRIAKEIGVQTEFKDSADYVLEGDRIGRLLNLLVQVKATEYISGPNAKEYLTPYVDLFMDKGITVRFKEYPEYKSYNQLSSPFEQRVSIMDMIAHLPFNQIGNFIWD